jgi:hypothetical protein
MSLFSVLAWIGVSSVSKGGLDVWGQPLLRTLVVLPMWPLAEWPGWSLVGVVCGTGAVGLAGAVVIWRRHPSLRTPRTPMP